MEAEPAITDRGGPAQGWRRMAPENDWGMRLLDRFGKGLHWRKGTKLSLKGRRILSPQHAHGLEVFTRALRTTLRRNPQGLKLLHEPANANTKEQPAFREPVQAGDKFGGNERITLRDQADARR